MEVPYPENRISKCTSCRLQPATPLSMFVSATRQATNTSVVVSYRSQNQRFGGSYFRHLLGRCRTKLTGFGFVFQGLSASNYKARWSWMVGRTRSKPISRCYPGQTEESHGTLRYSYSNRVPPKRLFSRKSSQNTRSFLWFSKYPKTRRFF